MSRPIASPSPEIRATSPAPTAPPAGPDSTLHAPWRPASRHGATPPEERMISGSGRPLDVAGLGQLAEVPAEQGGEVGVDHRRRAALVLAEPRQDLVRDRDVEVRAGGRGSPRAIRRSWSGSTYEKSRQIATDSHAGRLDRGRDPLGLAVLERLDRRRPARRAHGRRSGRRGRRAAGASARTAGRATGRSWRPISSRSSNPAVATSAVRAPRSSSSALVPTVIPWTRRATAAGSERAAPSTASTAAITPAASSPGVVGAFAVNSSRPVERDRVGEGPADVHSEQHASKPKRPGSERPGRPAEPLTTGPAGPVPIAAPSRRRRVTPVEVPYQRAPASATKSLTRSRRRPAPRRALDLDLGRLEGLLEMLVRGAVVAPRQRLALTRRALAGVRAAFARDAVELEQLGRALEQVERQRDVALDDVPDPELVADREVHPHLVEQRARRPGEVAAVGAEPADCLLACLQHRLPVAHARRVVLVLDHSRSQFPVDRSTEAVHVRSYPPLGPTRSASGSGSLPLWFPESRGDCYTSV